MDKSIRFKETFCIEADPAEMEKTAAINKSWTDATRKRNEKFLQRAGDKPIVRCFSRIGPCLFLGIGIRETPSFYVYAVNAHYDDGPLNSFPEKRISKSKAHIEPCIRCEDHPQTHYPMGYLD